MTQQFSIKDIRRIEQEVDNEINYVRNNASDIRQDQQQNLADAKKVGEKGVNELQAKMYELIEVRFKIRTIVAEFNKDNGINDRTLKIAILEQKHDFLEQSIIGFGRPGTTRDYHLDKVVYSPGITTEVVDEKRAEARNIKRQIQRLKDSCNGINSNAKFEVAPELVALFERYGFIDKQ